MKEPDAPPIYALRVAEDARRQIDVELVRLFDAVGEDAAVSWRLGMEDALASLATLPGCCPLAPENSVYQQVHHGVPLRQLLYRRRNSGPTWCLLFTLHKQTANDPPTVHVHQVRHGGQFPLTQWPNPADDTDA